MSKLKNTLDEKLELNRPRTYAGLSTDVFGRFNSPDTAVHRAAVSIAYVDVRFPATMDESFIDTALRELQTDFTRELDIVQTAFNTALEQYIFHFYVIYE